MVNRAYLFHDGLTYLIRDVVVDGTLNRAEERVHQVTFPFAFGQQSLDDPDALTKELE